MQYFPPTQLKEMQTPPPPCPNEIQALNLRHYINLLPPLVLKMIHYPLLPLYSMVVSLHVIEGDGGPKNKHQ